MTSTLRSLVLGMAAGYSYKDVQPFLKSLLDTGYAGKICLIEANIHSQELVRINEIVDDSISIDRDYSAYIHAENYQTVALRLRKVKESPLGKWLYPRYMRWVVKRIDHSVHNEVMWELEQRLEGYTALRFRHFLAYLNSHYRDYDEVLLCDVGDVIFQKDPFSYPLTKDLVVAMEPDDVRIGRAKLYRQSIDDVYGEQRLKRLGGQMASSPGTILGTRAGVTHYLNKMDSECWKRMPPIGYRHVALHNYLLWKGAFQPVEMSPNGSGPFITLGNCQGYNLNKEGQIVGKDGHIPAIVHQYNRFPELAQLIRKRYSDDS